MTRDFASFWEWVEKRRQSLAIPSIRQLEKDADLANGTLYSRMNSNGGPTVKVAEGLCKALDVSWLELWQHAGYVPKLPEIVPDSQIDALCRTFQRLPSDDRAAIVRIVKALVDSR